MVTKVKTTMTTSMLVMKTLPKWYSETMIGLAVMVNGVSTVASWAMATRIAAAPILPINMESSASDRVLLRLRIGRKTRRSSPNSSTVPTAMANRISQTRLTSKPIRWVST